MTAFRRLKPRVPVPDKLWPGRGAFGVWEGQSVQGRDSVCGKLPFRLGVNERRDLPFSFLLREYYATGDFVARVFAVGKTIKRQN